MGRINEPNLAKLPDLAWYRGALFGNAEASGVRDDDGGPIRRGVSAQRIRDVLESRGQLEPWERVRCRVRYFSDGLVIGTREFVEAFFDRMRFLP